MRPPHFRKLPKVSDSKKAAKPGAKNETVANEGEDGEVVIRANMVFLGSSVPHRLRVVCFEDPSAEIASRL